MAAVTPVIKMPITLQLSEQSRRKLAERAAQNGRDVAGYASELIERAINPPTLDELLTPVRQEAARGGQSEDQIMEFGRRELEALRRQKREHP